MTPFLQLYKLHEYYDSTFMMGALLRLFKGRFNPIMIGKPATLFLPCLCSKHADFSFHFSLFTGSLVCSPRPFISACIDSQRQFCTGHNGIIQFIGGAKFAV